MSSILYLLSPAKKLNTQPFDCPIALTQPRHAKEAKAIMKALRSLPGAQLEKVMAAKGKLLQEVIDMHAQWEKSPSFPAAAIYNGDAYTRLSARSWSHETWDFAQSHLWILSGLYGALKPTDVVQSYRLMVGAPWTPHDKFKNLYDHWRQPIQADLAQIQPEVIVNCASQEYSAMIEGWTQCPIIHIDFKVKKGDKLTSVSSFSKQARGELVRLAMENKITQPADLKKLEVLGYQFNNKFSDNQNWIYVK
jgi:cytoplasmic iron level regulating protein YaaA (DUF328/UPF0246 family)